MGNITEDVLHDLEKHLSSSPPSNAPKMPPPIKPAHHVFADGITHTREDDNNNN